MIVYAVNNPVCVSHEVTQRPDKSVKTSPDIEVIEILVINELKSTRRIVTFLSLLLSISIFDMI